MGVGREGVIDSILSGDSGVRRSAAHFRYNTGNLFVKNEVTMIARILTKLLQIEIVTVVLTMTNSATHTAHTEHTLHSAHRIQWGQHMCTESRVVATHPFSAFNECMEVIFSVRSFSVTCSKK